MKVTIEDIARKVGKSITTVSRALNDYPDVSPETKALVRRVAEELGYSPSMLAQRLQKQRSDTIGLIVPTHEPRSVDPFFSEFSAGVSKQAAEDGYDLLMITSLTLEDDIKVYHDIARSKRVDGFIIARTKVNDERIRYLSEIAFPFTSFGRTSSDPDYPFVDVDSYSGMRSIVDHLVRLGRRSFAAITAPTDLNFTMQRLNGIKDALNEHGLKLSEDNILTGNLTQESGYKLAEQLLHQPTRPDAILAFNDLMAFGAMNAARAQGITIGKQISITGFDDIPLAEHANPPLTTVNQPIYEIGMQVCAMLIKILRQEAIPQMQCILRPNLVIRRSCGAGSPPARPGNS
jgi:LacI family transcriptional regulator